MVAPIVKSLCLKFVFPAALLFAAFLRPCIISSVYVLLALLCPLLPSIEASLPLQPGIRGFVILSLLYCVLTTVGQLSYQIYERVSRPNDNTYLKQCNNTDIEWLRYAGFVRFHAGDNFESTRSILPEITALTASVITFFLVSVLPHRDEELDVVGNIQQIRSSDESRAAQSDVTRRGFSQFSMAFRRITNVVIIILAAIVGSIQPSLLNIAYFLAFLFVASWWSLYKPLRHGKYNTIKRFLLFWSVLHILAIYIYQIDAVQRWIPANDFLARFIGLSSLYTNSCDRWWAYAFNENNEWPVFVNPICVLVFYQLLVFQLVLTKNGSRTYFDDGTEESSVHEELLAGDDHDATPEQDEQPHGIPLRKVTSRTVDRHKISQIFMGERAISGNDTASEGLVSFAFFILHHSYAMALVTIMIWALVYHSIFGLILLVTCCVLWMFKDTRKACFRLSPVLTLYVEFLLLVQYVCSMHLAADELKVPDWLAMMGVVLAENMERAFVTLLVKVLLSLPVFLLLRLALRERFYDALSEHERTQRINQSYGTFTASRRVPLHRRLESSEQTFAVFRWFSRQLVGLWVFVVAIVLLVVAVQNSPVLYSIGFFIIWSFLIIYTKISLRFFRGIAYVFWLGIIVYTSVVIISLYVFQFPGFPDVWNRWTGLTKEWDDDIGLIVYGNLGQKGNLFFRLLWPICLFLVTTLQLKFFHSNWFEMTNAVPNASSSQEEGGEISATEKLTRLVNDFLELVWRFTEVHISKLVFIIVAIFIANNVCALYFPLVVLISLALCLPNAASGILSLIMCAYLAVVAVFKMIYQLQHIPDFGTVNIGGSCNATQSFSHWLGVEKNTNTWSLLNGLVISMIALGIQSIVVYRQRHHRIRNGESEDLKTLVFPSFAMRDLDQSLANGIRFLIDYGFFKFGLECTYILMGVNAWVRMDLLGSIMCVWLAFFALSKRSICRNLWPIFVLYMAIILPLQYALYVGLPEESCVDYPWTRFFDSPTKNMNFDVWMGLSNYKVMWPPGNLIADFFLLLAASCQLTVFRHESEENDSIYPDEHYELKNNNPHYDFIAQQRSFVDFIKIVVFHYGHWITLITTLGAGIGGTSLFALGYIVITFWILWQGNNLYVMNPQTNNFKSTLARWNTLLSYTTFTMFSKVALQLVGCVFLEKLSVISLGCVIRQVFSITCVNTIIKKANNELFPSADNFDKSCHVESVEAQIGFDTIALGFLVFQIRVFHSWYFQHCMVEYRSEVLQANRGAVLKNQLVEKEMKEQNIQQAEKFDEIRRRTQAIRERYNKQQAKGVAIFEPETYGQAKRAGDYYMFDYDPSTDELVEPVESFVPETDPQATKFDKLDPTQLVYVAGARDDAIAKTLEAIEKAEKTEDSERRMIGLVAPSEQPTEDVISPEEEPPAVSESKLLAALRFVKKILCNGMDWVSVQLNKLSREHRYVAFVLAKEKEKMKDNFSESLSNTTMRLTDIRSQMDMPSLQVVQSESDIAKMESEAHSNFMQRSSLARLVNAIASCVAANTDIICYFLAVLCHAMGGGLITLPLPLMVFFWGTLSNPRPSKFFWVTMIAYTELLIVVKFICQFNFWKFNYISDQNLQVTNPLSLEKWLGVQRQPNFAMFDVPLLFALFFHRYMLRKLGLWKDANLTITFADETQVDGINGSLTMETITHSRSNSVNQPGTSQEPMEDVGMEVAIPENGATAKNDESKAKNPIMRFIEQLFKPKFRYIRDLYPIMFGLDVVAFLIVAFGYSGFGEGGSGNVIGDIQKNRIPLTLVVMLIVMTLMIVIDRGLYLRKWVYGKLAYQLVIVVFIHVWIFFVLPHLTRKSALENHVAQALYIVKCLYLLVSAWQIRNGYPQLCIGNLLTHAYGLANMVFFKIFMAVPFLFELRTAIDWTWTDTSMPLFDFFNMENFYATIYNLKCARTFEANYPAPRGQPKGVIVKYFMGLPMILAIILLVWLPLLMFALLNQIGDISIPDRVTLTVSIEGYPALYQIEAQGGELRPCTDGDLDKLQLVMSQRFSTDRPDSVKRSRNTVSFLKDYSASDILIVDFRPESEIFWPISAESMEALRSQLLNNTSPTAENKGMHFQILMEFSRPYDPQKKVAAKHTYLQKIPISNKTEDRQKIVDALSGSGTITISNSFPSYTLVPNEGEVTVPEPLVASILYDEKKYQPTEKNAWFDTLTLNIEALGTGGKVWVTQAKHPANFSQNVFFNPPIVPYGTNRTYIETVSFIDRAYPSLFAKYLQGGVITMYISLVIVVGRLLRGVFTSSPSDIMVSEIPNPDYMLKICLDIYLVREAKDFFLEQDLFAKLIFLFRSPATLIQWTRYKVKND